MKLNKYEQKLYEKLKKIDWKDGKPLDNALKWIKENINEKEMVELKEHVREAQFHWIFMQIKLGALQEAFGEHKHEKQNNNFNN